MFFSKPLASTATLAPACIRLVAVGAAQYPVCPGGGPSRGWPSGHFGVGPLAALAAGLGAEALSKTFLFVFARTTELPQICRVPLRACRPCTFNASPGFTVSRV